MISSCSLSWRRDEGQQRHRCAFTPNILCCVHCQRDQITEGGNEEEDKWLLEKMCRDAALVVGGGRRDDNGVSMLTHAVSCLARCQRE